MYRKMKKSISLLITAAMLIGAVPQTFAETDIEDWEVSNASNLDTVTSESTAEPEQTETPEFESAEEEADESEELPYDETFNDVMVELMYDNPGLYFSEDFEGFADGADYSDNLTFADGKDGAESFNVISGSDMGRDGKILKIAKTDGGNGQKIVFPTWSLGNADLGERYIITSFDWASDNVSDESFELTMAGGNSGADICAGATLYKGTIRVFTGEGQIKGADTKTKYQSGEWHSVVMITHVNADNQTDSTTYYIDGAKAEMKDGSEALGVADGNKALKPDRLRMVFDKNTTNANFYIDNISIYDIKAGAAYVDDQFALRAADELNVESYITVDKNTMTLPTDFEGNTIEWSSSDTSVIDTSNMQNGVVPVVHNVETKQVTLTAKLKIDGMHGIKFPDEYSEAGISEVQFNVTVQTSTGEESDESIAHRIADAIVIDPSTVSTDFTLPTTTTIVTSGAEITWTSEDSSVITVNGDKATVTRPPYYSDNKQVKLTATVKYGTATASKQLTVTVVKNEGPVTDEENVRYAKEQLESLGFNTELPRAISTDISLLTSIENATLTWKSSDTSWLTDDGQIVQMPEAGSGAHDVDLTVTITSGSATETLTYIISIKPVSAPKAYPGAQGYGTQTRGGAGGYVCHVTSLAAEGPGTLKEAMEDKSGTRIIVFDVGGTIDLTSLGRALRLDGEAGSNVTIAGQTAPGDGIQLKGYGINLNAVEDVIIRNISIRIGNVRKYGDTYQSDPLTVSGATKRVVLDHLSMCWGVDMGFRVDGEEVTMSNCMISKGLYWNTPHEKGKHNYAGMFRAKYGSFYNNYIADMGQRAPRIIDNEYIDVRNNVVYNSKYSFDICNYEWMGANTKFNIVNNMVLKGNTAPGGATGNTSSGGSYKYFQGRDYSGGVITYTINNLDNTKGARPSVSSYRDGALWDVNTSIDQKKKVLGEELGVINAGQYSNTAEAWRDMIFPDDISIEDYDASQVALQGNTLVNYPFPAPEMTTRDADDAAKYVLSNAGAKYPVRGILDNRYLTEARTRLKVESDYSKASQTQGIKLTDEDIANMEDPSTAYGLPVHTHTVYKDKYGSTVYDVDGYDITNPEEYTIVEQYKFVQDEENDLNSLYVTDTDGEHKYRIVTEEYDDDDDIYDKFEVYDVNNKQLTKPSPYVSDSDPTDGMHYTLDGQTIVLNYSDWGDGPGNYQHDTDSDDPNISAPNVDTEWTDEDWPQLPTVYRGDATDMEENPELYVNRRFDSNNDGIPDYFVRLMGWDKRDDYDSKKDISYLDYEGRGYTNLEYYINDYLCGDVEVADSISNEPVQPENVRDGSDRYNTHRSHQILFNTVRRAKAKVYYCEGSEFDLDNATEINLNSNYDTTSDTYDTASDFKTYFSVTFPNVTSATDITTSLKPDTTYTYKIKTYSDSGVEYLSDTYSFKTEPISADKPNKPRITKYIELDERINLQFEPYAPLKSYDSDSENSRLLTTIESNQYENIVDHYVIRYSTNQDMSDAVTINVSGNMSNYTISGLDNDNTYYIELKAVNASGIESDSAVYNAKKAEELDETDKDGNKLYGVKGITVSGGKVEEYFYDTDFKTIGVNPTRYAVKEDYNAELTEAGIGENETAKFITYYGDVKDWYIYTLGGIPIPTNYDGKMMLMLRDEAHEHGFTYAKKFDTPLTGKSTVECRLMIDDEVLDPMNQNPEFRFYLQEASGGEDTDSDVDSSSAAFGNIATITFAKNEINYNGKAYARYEDGVWYDLKVLMDSDAKTCSIYINDELIASDLEYLNYNSEDPTALQRWQLGSRLAGTEDVYIEYMYAYSGWTDPETGEMPGQSEGGEVEEGTSGSRPSGSGSSGGGGGGGGGDTIIRDGDFSESPKVDKSTPAPEATEIPKNYINTSFNDMGGFEWAVEAVQSLYEQGIVTGVGNNLFVPEREVTRAEFITMLMRGFGLVGKDAQCNFTDVNDGDWYYNAIASASAMGIVTGYPDGSFGVNDHISRQDMAVMCVRLAQSIGLEFDSTVEYNGFADGDSISDYAKESVETLYKAGIVNGTGDNNFTPRGEANRAQAAKIVYEMLKVQ